MNAMHSRVLTALDSKINNSVTQQSVTQLATLKNHIDHYHSNVPVNAQLGYHQKEQTLEVPPLLRKSLNQEQKNNLEALILNYVQGGLNLLLGVNKLNKQLSIYQNSQETHTIDSDMKHLYRMPERDVLSNQQSAVETANEQEDQEQQEQPCAKLQAQDEMQTTKLEADDEQLNNGNFSGMYRAPQSSPIPQNKVGQAEFVPQFRSRISAFAKSFGRKKKAALSEQQIENLQFDLKNPNLTKQLIQRKYDISESTLNRYVRRFRQWQEQANNLQFQQRQLEQKRQEQQKQLQIKMKLEQKAQAEQRLLIQQRGLRNIGSAPAEGRRSKVRMVEQKVVQIYKKYPNIYQSDVAQQLTEHFGTEISIHVVSRCLKNIQNKKRQIELMGSMPSEEERLRYQKMDQNSPKIIDIRYVFAKEFLRRNPAQLIFVDEIQHRNEQQRTSKEGQAPPWNEINFAFALNSNGKLVNSKVKNRFFNVEEIIQFLQQLAGGFPGAIIVLDCARIHKDERVRQVTRQKGAQVVYLPALSPQFNPVQNIFPLFLNLFAKRVSATLPLEQALKIARQCVLQLKQCKFNKEVQAARHCVEMASMKQPLPFPRKSQ